MVKRNWGKGGRRHRRKKKGRQNNAVEADMDNGTMYASVVNTPGGKYLKVLCADGKERNCHISGKFWKRVYCRKGDIVVVSLRDEYSFDTACDLCGKPNQNTVKRNLSVVEKDIFFGKENDDVYDITDDYKSNVSSVFNVEEDKTLDNPEPINNDDGSNKFLEDDNEDNEDEFDDFDLL